MKKIVPALLLVSIAFLGYAQPKLGLIVGPSLSMNQVKYIDDGNFDYSNDGAAFKFRFGLEADFMLSETYAFSTGAIFAPKRAGFSINPTDGSAPSTQDYKVHYLQLPVTLKLFTSEIQPDLKLFFQLGFKGEIKLFDEPFKEDYDLIEKFHLFDCSFTGGVGVEYGAGINTVLFGGIFYDRGLVNIVKSSIADNSLTSKMHTLDLKLGLKF
ncbi:Outer membrane protein beta-barrel domain-containing protein [Reichenbachiella faecimaris]|uniref:Outer membrane protein beta-barrel domain-containing protein n=1 Tax=Reichenbachiella faecimaris TaxID=692418 RepID=A0A1W2GET2_REIFA|nr:porin family protein [Reichenbachiella faecimaris]SMD35155.1 Outer membrane protein beta-barrel domain-containing protein [Reichenbachiella faecimaris]